MLNSERLEHSTYMIRTKVFKLFGGSYDVYGPNGDLVLYAKKRAFKLKEDIRLYSDKAESEELLTIKAREIFDFSAAYDVVDAVSGQRLGAFKRKGWKSLMRDEWVMMDASDQDVGVIKEDSAGRAALRRLMAFAAINLIPQKYHCEIDGKLACSYKQNFNPLVTKISIDFSNEGAEFGTQTVKMDKKMGLAAAVLLSAIEGKQGG